MNRRPGSRRLARQLPDYRRRPKAAEQARDTAKAQLATLRLDADAVTRNLDQSSAGGKSTKISITGGAPLVIGTEGKARSEAP